jgi:hypothetical protein
MEFTFGDIVVVEEELIGVVVKSWISSNSNGRSFNYDVYVRSYNEIKNYEEKDIERYMVRHKYLSDEEKEYQYNAINGY